MNCGFAPEDGGSKARPALALLPARCRGHRVLERSHCQEWSRGSGLQVLVPLESRRSPRPRFRPQTESARIRTGQSEPAARIRWLRLRRVGAPTRSPRIPCQMAVPTLLRPASGPSGRWHERESRWRNAALDVPSSARLALYRARNRASQSIVESALRFLKDERSHPLRPAAFPETTTPP